MADQGAANYTVGTHQTALAESQRGTRVWGNAFALAVFAVGHTFVAAPQSQADVQPQVWGPQPISASAVQRGSLWAAPEQIQSGSADLWGPQPDTASGIPNRTFWAAPDQLQTGKANLWGPVPPTASEVPGRILKTTPEQVESGYVKLWSQPPESVIPPTLDVGAAYYTVGTHQDAIAGSQNRTKTWGTPPTSVAPGDVLPIGQIIVHPQQYSPGFAKLWGTSVDEDRLFTRYYEVDQQSTEQWAGKVWGVPPPTASALIGRTLKAAPEQIESGRAVLHGLPPESLGAVLSPHFLVTKPQQFDPGSADVWGTVPPSLDSLPPKTIIGGVQAADLDYIWMFRYPHHLSVTSSPRIVINVDQPKILVGGNQPFMNIGGYAL